MQKPQNSFSLSSNQQVYLPLCLALTLVGFITACGGPNIHSQATENKGVLVREWTRPTHLQGWAAGETSEEYSNAALYENTLIFGSRSGGLASLYPISNQVRWVLPIPNGVESEIAVFGDTIYFGGGDGFLYSVQAETGRVNWRYEVRTPMISRPTVHQGRLFITTAADTVSAFDANTGKWLWHYRRRSSQAATIRGSSSPLVYQNQLLVGLSDGFLVSLSVADGKLIWEKKLHEGRKFTDIDAQPILKGGVVYVPSYDGALYAITPQSGNIIWKFDAGGGKSISYEDGKIFLPSSDGSIYVLSSESGKVLWKFELDGGVPTRIVSTDQYLVFGSTYQYLYALDKKTGKLVYRYNVGYKSGFSGSPIYDPIKKRIYILSGAGNLYAFKIRNPRRKILPRGMSDPYQFITITH